MPKTPCHETGSTARERSLIEGIHRRLLENATDGRLTFVGDRVVSIGSRRPALDLVTPIPELVETEPGHD